MPKIVHRNPLLTLASSDDLVPDLCRVLAGLGYDPGPIGALEVSTAVLAAVEAFRVEQQFAEDPADLPAATEPSSAIGAATWCELHAAAERAGLYPIGHEKAGQKAPVRKAPAKRRRRTTTAKK